MHCTIKAEQSIRRTVWHDPLMAPQPCVFVHAAFSTNQHKPTHKAVMIFLEIDNLAVIEKSLDFAG